MQLVLQGNLWPGTYSWAEQYLQLPFVEKVIISTWEDQALVSANDRIIVVRSKKPEINAPGNMNYQIVSSKTGVLETDPKDGIVAKLRSDQQFFNSSLELMNAYFTNHLKTVELRYSDNSGPDMPMFVLGMASRYPFHPQDHVFWGSKKDVLDVFSLPLMDGDVLAKDCRNFNIDLRMPIYLGSHYCARFCPIIYDYLKDFRTYLMDNAEKRPEAMELSLKIRDKIFKSFPRIDKLMYWAKYRSDYWYDTYAEQGEYYGEPKC